MDEFCPLITIITPTYNRAKFISEAIESVLKQTYTNWELLIVDDGSTDNTKDVISSYLLDPRIKYYYQSNQGQAVARQSAFLKSEGDYIAFLDSDNRWLSNRLAVGVDYLSLNPTEIPYGDGVSINESGDEISRENMQRHSGNLTALLIRDNFVSMNTTLIPKVHMTKIGGLRTSVKRGDDFDLYLRLSTVANFKYIPEYMVEYRVMKDQISTDKRGRFSANEKVIDLFLSEYPYALSKHERDRSLASFYIRKGRYYASQGEFSISFKDLFKAMKLAPLWIGVYRAYLKVMKDGVVSLI